jgi:hypothetical protein
MTWTSGSAIFQQAMLNPISRAVSAATAPGSFVSLTGDAVKVAVYGSNGTPNKADVVANTGYNTGQWVNTNEVTGTGWAAGGVAVGTTKTWTVDSGSSSLCYQVTAPTAGQTGPTAGVTLTGFVGCFVYDSTITSGSTVAAQGMCYNYFGGSQTITAGNFTILWATPGGAAITAIFNIAV